MGWYMFPHFLEQNQVQMVWFGNVLSSLCLQIWSLWIEPYWNGRHHKNYTHAQPFYRWPKLKFNQGNSQQWILVRKDCMPLKPQNQNESVQHHFHLIKSYRSSRGFMGGVLANASLKRPSLKQRQKIRIFFVYCLTLNHSSPRLLFIPWYFPVGNQLSGVTSTFATQKNLRYRSSWPKTDKCGSVVVHYCTGVKSRECCVQESLGEKFMPDETIRRPVWVLGENVIQLLHSGKENCQPHVSLHCPGAGSETQSRHSYLRP